MFEHGISKKWLHRAQIAIYVFFGTFAIGGLWYVFYSAFHRDVFGALIGAGVVWGSIGLGIGMHCVTQMAAIVDGNQRALADLQLRNDAIEELLAQIGPAASLPTPESGAVSPLVSASTDESYPRIVREAEEPDSSPAEQVAEATVAAAIEARSLPPDADVLRSDFREAMFDHDYARALTVGFDIAEAFPDSPMSKQFHELRPVLELRACSSASALHSTVV